MLIRAMLLMLFTGISYGSKIEQCFEPDHYISYPLNTTTFFPRVLNLNLSDQFTNYPDVDALTPSFLFNPAIKIDDNGEFIPKKPKIHYVGFPVINGAFTINTPLTLPTGINIEVFNQFGTFTLTGSDLGPADTLLLPSLKMACDDCDDFEKEMSIEPLSFFNGDHYLCYPINKPITVSVTGSLEDQFEQRDFANLSASRLCNPVQKTDALGTFPYHHNPENHFMCFNMTPNPVAKSLSVANQFGIEQGYVNADQELCLPSTKEDIIETTCFDSVNLPLGFTIRYVDPNGTDAANNCTQKDNACKTILYAMSVANAGDVIELLSGIFVENNLPVNQNLNFFGQGAPNSIVDGTGGNNGIFTVATGINVSFCELTLTNGENLPFPIGGGAISNNGTANITNCTIENNTGIIAGGILNQLGTININNSTIENNTGNNAAGGINNNGGIVNIINSIIEHNNGDQAGGIVNGSGIVNIINSTMGNNTSPGGAGGIFNNGGTANIINSTIENNSANFGGGIYNFEGMLNITNCTIYNNSAEFAEGGAIFNDLGSTVLVNDSTITQNTSTTGGALHNNSGATTNVFNTIIGDQLLGANCSGTIGETTTFGTGYNIESDDSCLFLAANHSINNTSPNLGALGNNGGPTQTCLPNAGSPVINAGPVNCGVSTDQRGFPRPVGGFCDIGSVEVQ